MEAQTIIDGVQTGAFAMSELPREVDAMPKSTALVLAQASPRAAVRAAPTPQRRTSTGTAMTPNQGRTSTGAALTPKQGRTSKDCDISRLYSSMVLPQSTVAKRHSTPTQGALQLAEWLRGAGASGLAASCCAANTASSNFAHLALVTKEPAVEAPEVARARERAKRAKNVVAFTKMRAMAAAAKQAAAANNLREIGVVATQSNTRRRRWYKSSDLQNSNNAVRAPTQESTPLSSSKQSQLEDPGATSVSSARRKPASKEGSTRKRQRMGQASHMPILGDSDKMAKTLQALCDIAPPTHSLQSGDENGDPISEEKLNGVKSRRKK